MAKYENAEQKGIVRELRFMCMAAGAGVVLSLGVLLAAAFALSGGALSESFLFPAIMIAGAAGAFFSGFMSGKKLRSQGLLNGMIAGGVYYLALLLIGVIFMMRFMPSMPEALWILGVSILGGAAGGVAGVN